MQESELFFDEEQEDNHGTAGNEEVLQALP